MLARAVLGCMVAACGDPRAARVSADAGCDPERALAADEPEFPFATNEPPPLPTLSAEEVHAILARLILPGEVLVDERVVPYVEIGHLVLMGVAGDPARLIAAFDTGEPISLEDTDRRERNLSYARHGRMTRAAHEAVMRGGCVQISIGIVVLSTWAIEIEQTGKPIVRWLADHGATRVVAFNGLPWIRATVPAAVLGAAELHFNKSVGGIDLEDDEPPPVFRSSPLGSP